MFRGLLAPVVAVCVSSISLSQGENEDTMLLTPVGYWPAKCIHGVSAGSHITNLNETAFMIKDSISHEESIKTRCDATYVRKMRSKFASESTQRSYKSKNAVDGDGWQQYTKQLSGNSTDAFLGYWPVPEEPERKGQTLFTFTGLQNIDWVPPSPEPEEDFDIIQPVLQYGESAAGGGSYWTIASWYVTLGLDVVYSTLQEVKSGVSLFGNMTKTGEDEWYIAAIDQSTNVNSDITVSKSRLITQPWAYVTLEVYEVFSCEQYPKQGTPIPYTQLELYIDGQATDPTWEIGTDGQNPPICNSSIDIIDPNAVTITF